MAMDRHVEKKLLITELDQYYRQLELAELYDNLGDREWYQAIIKHTEGKLSDLYINDLYLPVDEV